MSKPKGTTYKEFQCKYSTDEACREKLFEKRFPDGFICPVCGCTEYYTIKKRNTCQCKSCRHQTSVTAGTVMHRSHLPLTTWFWAIYLCVTDKRGISAVQLSRNLGIGYETAWYLLARIRKAMGQRNEEYQLSGIVEMDDAYIGGPSHNGKRGRGTDKTKIVVSLSKSPDGVPFFVRMKVVEDLKHDTIQGVADEVVKNGSNVESDGASAYANLSGVNVTAKPFEVGDLHWLHVVISNLKTFLLGTYHGRCTKFQNYLDEFCYRFNRRMNGDQILLRSVCALAASCSC